jgi:hypothetical protein
MTPLRQQMTAALELNGKKSRDDFDTLNWLHLII